MPLQQLPFHIDLTAWQPIAMLLGVFASSIVSSWLGWRNTLGSGLWKKVGILGEIHPVAKTLFTRKKVQEAERYQSDSRNLEEFSSTVTSGFDTLALVFGLAPAITWAVFTAFPSIWPCLGIAISMFLVSLAGTLVNLPFSYLETFSLEENHGMNRMTRGLFATDTLKGILVQIALSVPFSAACAYVLQRCGDMTVSGYAIILGAFVASGPVWEIIDTHVVSRLFNKFEPLRKGSLKKKLDAIMRRNGMEASSIVVMDSGRRSARTNAYVHGIGRRKRIVLFDELLKNLSEDEIVAIVAHEIGHAKLHHILFERLQSVAMTAMTVALAIWLMNDLSLYHAFGYRFVTPENLPSFRLVGFGLSVALMGSVTWILSPLMSWISRKMEKQADAFAAKEAGKDPLRTSLMKLNADNLSELAPDPMYEAWNYSHPSILPRLEAIGEVPEEDSGRWARRKTPEKKSSGRKRRRRGRRRNGTGNGKIV